MKFIGKDAISKLKEEGVMMRSEQDIETKRLEVEKAKKELEKFSKFDPANNPKDMMSQFESLKEAMEKWRKLQEEYLNLLRNK